MTFSSLLMVYNLLIFYADFGAKSVCAFYRRYKKCPDKRYFLLPGQVFLRCHPAWRLTRPLLTHYHALVFLTEIVLRLAYSVTLSALPSEAHSSVLSLPRSHHPRALLEGSLHVYSSSSTVFFILTPTNRCVKRFFEFFKIIFADIWGGKQMARGIDGSACA